MKGLIAFSALLGFVPGAASAAVFTSRDAFAVRVAVRATESFEGITAGDKGTSFQFSNAILSNSVGLRVAAAGIASCVTGQCITAPFSIETARVFSGFETGTTGFGFDLSARSSLDQFAITVQTGAGTQNYAITGASTFFGVSDLSGILSVDVRNNGSGQSRSNYSFDNISTGIASPDSVTASRRAFEAAATGPILTESFEGITAGDKGTSFQFSNAILSNSVGLRVAAAGSASCVTGQCITAPFSIETARVFSGFETGTTGFGFDLSARSSLDQFAITVQTGAGTQNYAITGASTFFGVSDLSGILSVDVRNNGSGQSRSNYSFDNISTYGRQLISAPVPEPSTWGLMLAGFGLVGLGVRARRRLVAFTDARSRLLGVH